jgi:hypothetical protein
MRVDAVDPQIASIDAEGDETTDGTKQDVSLSEVSE